MRSRSFIVEAEQCRRQAAKYAGKPEAQFLLHVARSFEDLETVRGTRSADR
jgi:hypothetical protein